MNIRLSRIQALMLSLTTVMTLSALVYDFTTPMRIVLGGGAAWLDFVVIRTLAAAMVSHRPAKAHIVPMAVLKSVVLVSVPAVALLLPGSIVTGVSFAIGVSALPTAIVLDACIAIPALARKEI